MYEILVLRRTTTTLAIKSEETRQKLIEAAGQIFAEVCYDAATVRQITDRAEVNLGAINYHFGDKLQLYREVLTEVFSQRCRLLEERCTHGPPEKRFRSFIEWMMAIGETDKSHGWHRMLVMLEINATPLSKAPELMVELNRPVLRILASIVGDLAGPALSRSEVEIASHFVIALSSYWLHRTEFLQKLSPELTFNERQIRQLVDQTYHFALGGISRVRRSSKRLPGSGKS